MPKGGLTMIDLALMAGDERPWAAFGACRDAADPDVFFANTAAAEREALRICGGCPVRLECLEWAIEMRERYGVWGGMTERQRRRLIRRSA